MSLKSALTVVTRSVVSSAVVNVLRVRLTNSRELVMCSGLSYKVDRLVHWAQCRTVGGICPRLRLMRILLDVWGAEGMWNPSTKPRNPVPLNDRHRDLLLISTSTAARLRNPRRFGAGDGRVVLLSLDWFKLHCLRAFPLAADKFGVNCGGCISALYNSALRQSKAIRADLDAFSTSSTSSSNPALQGQLTTTISSFSRTLDDYQRNIDAELVAAKAQQGRERITNFRSDLLDFRSRFAELKHEREAAQHASNRNDLLGRRTHVSGTPENPYADAAATSSGAGRGENVNPLFRTSNPNFTPGADGRNSYSAYQSPYGLGQDQARETHALREQNFFSSTNQTLDEYLERGRTVLGDLGDQREMLKNTQMKLYNIGNTLGISGDTIRMVERRAKQDKWIFWGGVAGFVVFVYLVLRFLR
nr:protein transport protein bos1 [Quercus suber]